MKASRITKLLPLPLLFLAGCFWGDEYEAKHLIGPYYLYEAGADAGTWYLHFDDEAYGLADALFNSQIVAVGFNDCCIIMQGTGVKPQFYILPVTHITDRENARRNVRGPFNEQKFKTELKRICGDEVPQFDSKLTN